jgi:hypothetical protein
VGETVAQTYNTWARTGRSEAAPAPFYARPTVQLGTAVGFLGVGLVAWFLLMRGASSGVAASMGTVPSPTDATPSAAAQSIATKPVMVKPASPPVQRDPMPSAGVRPVHDLPPPATQDPVVVDERSPLEDDDPRAARNFRDDATTYPAANAKKKDLAAAARKPRPKPAVRQPAPERDPERDNSPAPPAKKSSTLDLFNDTK